ncbi:hypothetical protein D9757_015344 [Collybiopsis confluens]|uniref:Uncharacterized protein n=1 Tax=Collybiopsis confluens TaxID=2823264 RepID=A0A8H5FQC6_9AGAR|nr:hypothetical protein D9757_015344 [Collybiopsis confluens]
MTGTYTDDTLGGSSSSEERDKVKQEIGERYRIRDADTVQFALGMKLTHDRQQGSTTLSMPAYWENLLAKHGFDASKPKATLLPPGTALSSDPLPMSAEESYFMRDKPYREVLGAVQFGAGACRSDIAEAANVLSRD